MNTRHFDFTRRPKAKSVCSDRWHDLTVVIYGTILRVVYFNRTTRTTVSNSSCMRLGRSHTSQWCYENQPFLFQPNPDISTPLHPWGGLKRWFRWCSHRYCGVANALASAAGDFHELVALDLEGHITRTVYGVWAGWGVVFVISSRVCCCVLVLRDLF